MPTEEQWQQHLADEANTTLALKTVVAQLAHAGHPFKLVDGKLEVGKHVLDPAIRASLKKLDAAIARQARNAKAPRRRAAGVRAGHGRGKSRDVE